MSETKELLFEDLPIRRRKLVPTSPNQYRVTSAFGEVKLIDASTAYEAFKQTNFTSAVKIERVSNLDVTLLEKTKFSDYTDFDPISAFSDVTPAVTDPFQVLKLRKNPILSANELDDLMHSLQQMAPSPAGDAGLVLGTLDSISDSVEGLVPATGMDVHGDGFDEIIPAQAIKPAATPKTVEAAEPQPAETAAAAPVADLPPQQELSQEEIEKLLNGQ